MRTDVIIVGSGIIGMSLALSLSMKKKKVIIVEKNFLNNFRVNRIYAISEKTKIESLSQKWNSNMSSRANIRSLMNSQDSSELKEFIKERKKNDIGFYI